MDLQATHIAGKLEALGASRHTQQAKNSVEYVHMRFSSLHNSDLKMMEEIVVSNLLDSYIRPGLKGNFYFVEFDDQLYLVGLKMQSCEVFDQELFRAVLPVEEQEHRLLIKNSESIATLLKLNLIIRTVFIISLLGGILFPPAVIIIGAIWWLTEIYFYKMAERKIKKNQEIRDQIEHSENLSLQEMKRIME
jgi:hypothetical protein